MLVTQFNVCPIRGHKVVTYWLWGHPLNQTVLLTVELGIAKLLGGHDGMLLLAVHLRRLKCRLDLIWMALQTIYPFQDYPTQRKVYWLLKVVACSIDKTLLQPCLFIYPPSTSLNNLPYIKQHHSKIKAPKLMTACLLTLGHEIDNPVCLTNSSLDWSNLPHQRLASSTNLPNVCHLYLLMVPRSSTTWYA